MDNQRARSSEDRSWLPEVTYEESTGLGVWSSAFFSRAWLPGSCWKLIMGLLENGGDNSALGLGNHGQAKLFWARSQSHYRPLRSRLGEACGEI